MTDDRQDDFDRGVKNRRAVLGDVVKVTVFLGDLADFAAFNTEYARHFGASLPARSTVGGARLYGGARIEIEAVAVVPPPLF
jgi:2-iminobutanoate/2-iminopropanoate deaminase